MGNLASRLCFSSKSSSSSSSNSESPEPVQYSWDKKQQDNSESNNENLIIKNKSDETIVRNFRNINNEAINLDNLSNCNIIVKDVINGAIIDNCSNCLIFIALSNESIFIRDCKDCIFIGISTQIRLRDVENLSMIIKCESTLAIEDAVNLKIACFDFDFPELNQILNYEMENHQIFNNIWYKNHNFSNAGPNAANSNWQQSCTLFQSISEIEDLENLAHNHYDLGDTSILEKSTCQNQMNEALETLSEHEIVKANSDGPIPKICGPENLLPRDSGESSPIVFTVLAFENTDKRFDIETRSALNKSIISNKSDYTTFRSWEGTFKNLKNHFEVDFKNKIIEQFLDKNDNNFKNLGKAELKGRDKALDLIYLICLEGNRKVRMEQFGRNQRVVFGSQKDSDEFFGRRDHAF